MAASAIPCTLWWARKRPSAKCQAHLLPEFSKVSTRGHWHCCQPLCQPVVDETESDEEDSGDFDDFDDF